MKLKNLILYGLIFLFIASCGKKGEERIKIGVIMPLTGPVAEPGNLALDGIRLAVDDFNSSNTKHIELIIEDSKSNPTDGVSAMNKLVSADNIKIVIGDIMSSVFLAISPIAERNKIVAISPGASNPKVRDAGDYIFRDYTSDNFDGYAMANYLYKKLGKRFVAVINVNDDYGVGVKTVFIDYFKKMGGNIIINENYPKGETNFRNLIIKLKNKNIDALYVVGNPTENGYMIKQLKELNIKIPITGNLSFENNDFLKIAKGAFDSVIYSTPYFDINSNKSYVQKFVKLYQEKFNREPDIAVGLGYDVANILIKVLNENNYDISKVKDGLYMIKNYEGVTGNTTFDNKGDVEKDIEIKKIYGNGSIETLEVYNVEK